MPPLPSPLLLSMSHIFLAGHRRFDRNGLKSQFFSRPQPSAPANPRPARSGSPAEAPITAGGVGWPAGGRPHKKGRNKAPAAGGEGGGGGASTPLHRSE